jgi:multiple antibiotic resistance protein
MIDFVATFIVFFAVVDPIGTVPVFIAVTSHFDNAAKKKIALIATLVAAAVLMFFVVMGEIILVSMSISLSAFQVAGGIILFIFALTMIFGESKPDQEVKLVENYHETAVFPLAVPSIASPGVILTAVLLTENSRFSLWEQAQVTSMMLVVLFVTYLFMRLAGQINRLIGAGGASLVSRVMGLVLASVATSHTLEGIKLYFEL